MPAGLADTDVGAVLVVDALVTTRGARDLGLDGTEEERSDGYEREDAGHCL